MLPDEKDLNPRFPYRIEKAHWYLLFLWMEHILTEEEFNRAMERRNKIMCDNNNNENDVTERVHHCPDGTVIIEHDFGDDEVIEGHFTPACGLRK